MQRILNNPDDVVDEMLQGFLKAHPDIVEAIMKEIRRCREDIGDALTHTAGKNVRAIGYAENPKPLTEYKEDYPYLVAMYDKTEVG